MSEPTPPPSSASTGGPPPGRVPPVYAPAATATAPPPARDGALSYGQFLGRTVTVVVVGLLVAALLGFLGILGLVGLVGAVASFDPSSVPTPTESVAGERGAREQIRVVRIEGPILAGPGGAIPFGGVVTGAEDVRAELQQLAEDDRVVAVVLEVNTPGGSVSGSSDLLAAIEEYQDATGRPVVAYVREISASGGVYATASADRIVAHPESIVGSVGVLFGPFRSYDDVVAIDDGLLLGGVSTTGGVDEFYVTAGARKDLGDPFRGFDDTDRAVIQRLVDTAYDGFVTVMAENRPLTEDALRETIGADILSGPDALEVGFVDALGRFDDAWQLAAELAEVDEVDVRAPVRPAGLFGSFARRGEADVSSLCAPTQRALVYHGDLSAFCAVARASAP